MSKYTDLAKNTFIIAFGKIATQFVTFFLLPLYTYFLTPAEFGFADLVVTYLALAIPALTLQLEMASFRFLVDARKQPDMRRSVISNILIHMYLPIVIVMVIGFVAYGIIFNFEYYGVVLAAGVSMMLANILLQITRGLGDNKKFAIGSMIIGLTTALSAVILIAHLGLKIEGMFLSLAVANIAGAAYLVFANRIYRDIKFNLRDKNLQREVLGYSVPLVPNGIAWWVINVSDRTIIAVMLGIAANGIYAVSNKYSTIFMSFFNIFNMSWTESASLHIDAKDRDKFFSDVSNVAVRMFGALGAGLIAVIPFIFPLMVDESFREAYYYIPILIIGAFFNAIVGLYSAIYIAKKLTKQVMNTSLAAAVINIVLTVSLVPLFGLYAAAVATAIAFLAMAVFRHFDVKKYVKITYEKNSFIALVILYTIVITIYYAQDAWASILALFIVLVGGLLLNRTSIGMVRKKAYTVIKGTKKMKKGE